MTDDREPFREAREPESIPWLGECANCGYHIRLVPDVGWIHAVVPEYDGHECDEARFEANAHG